MSKKSFVIVLIISTFIVSTLFASAETSGNVKLIVSSAPEFKVEAGYNAKFPIWGEGPLFGTNNVKVKALVGLSPVAATFSVESVLTPIAIAELSIGGSVGTGWDFTLLDNEGLRLGNGNSAATSDQLKGAYYKAKAAAALQFDTAAIWSGEWNSVVMRTYHEINYQGYTNSAAADGWEYETGGLHQDSFNYKGEYLVGYQMPIMVNTVAIMVETFYENINTTFDLGKMTMDIGLVANLNFMDNLNLTIIPQMTTRYIDGKDGTKSRSISHGSLRFKRVAAMLNYSF